MQKEPKEIPTMFVECGVCHRHTQMGIMQDILTLNGQVKERMFICLKCLVGKDGTTNEERKT